MLKRGSEAMEDLVRSVLRWASGDLSHRAAPEDSRYARLAEAMNEMAATLDRRMRALARRNTELEVVLAGMVEGVLAVDVEERVINLNQSAAKLLGVDAATARGRHIQEVARNVPLHRFVERALAGPGPVEAEIVVQNEGERYMQAHGSLMRDERDRIVGAVVVLNDVTRLRRLEAVRRDFVANVSHELKTPVTSIKGFVETLLDGALDDRDDLLRFLAITAKQADRLSAIIDDLLTLSRLEQESERREIPVENSEVRKALESAMEACSIKASAKEIEVQLDCPGELRWTMNAPLIEQAVVNLIDNAVKYSDPASRVRVDAAIEGNELVVRVQDSGHGIAREHLPRLFERFYRVDKARSRKMGGTGLGLAIVKHIAQVHGGRPEVASSPGRGSVFSIRLPRLH